MSGGVIAICCVARSRRTLLQAQSRFRLLCHADGWLLLIVVVAYKELNGNWHAQIAFVKCRQQVRLRYAELSGDLSPKRHAEIAIFSKRNSYQK